MSSQFLENNKHFLGLVPFHYGLLIILFAHVILFLFPQQVLGWYINPVRLYLVEYTGLVFAFVALFGLVIIIFRRLFNPRIKVVTTITDWILYALVLVQIITGIGMALYFKWGSAWFASSLSPYLWSLVKMNPDTSYIAGMPWLVKCHIVNAFLILGFFPFTRLVHVLVTPLHYFGRKTQVVRWYWNKRTIRKTNES